MVGVSLYKQNLEIWADLLKKRLHFAFLCASCIQIRADPCIDPSMSGELAPVG